MSLAIHIKTITQVLLTDGWHSIQRGSFNVDAYEFMDDDYPLVGGGSVAGIPSTGASWIEEVDNGSREWEAQRLCCPLTAILAIRQVKLGE